MTSENSAARPDDEMNRTSLSEQRAFFTTGTHAALKDYADWLAERAGGPK